MAVEECEGAKESKEKEKESEEVQTECILVHTAEILQL